MDGLDVASVRFPIRGRSLDLQLEAFGTLDYPDAMKEALWNVMTLEAEQLARLDHEWGVWVGRSVTSWMAANACPPPTSLGLMAILCTTSQRRVGRCKLEVVAALHAALGVPVVCDLRRLDMAFGGRGAPLVPLGG